MNLDETLTRSADALESAVARVEVPTFPNVLERRGRTRRRAMLAICSVLVLVGGAALAVLATRPTGPARVTAGPPTGPCHLLTDSEVASAVHEAVHGHSVVPALVTHEPLCRYDAFGRSGAVTVDLRTNARARYFEDRDRYVRDFPGSAHHVDGIGDDAYISGSASMTVLSGSTELGISVQYANPDAPTALRHLAALALRRL